MKYFSKGKSSPRKMLGTTLVVILMLMVALSHLAVAKTHLTILRPGTPEKVKRYLEPAIEEFEAANPDIDVEPVYMGWQAWINKYQTLFQAGDQPDVILWWDKQLSEAGVREKLVPLEDYVDKEVIAAFPDSLIEAGKRDGKLYLLPVSACSFVFMYRKDVFAEAGLDPNKPPQTFQEMLEYAKRIKQKTDVVPIGLQAKATEPGHEQVALLYHAWTGKPFLKDNKPIFNTPEAVEMLEFWKSLKPYAQPGAMQYDRGDLRAPFRDGKIAMIFGDSAWIVPMLQEKFGKNLDDSPIGFALPPAGPAGRVSWLGADGWAITNKDKAEAAGRLISFLSSPEQQYRHDSIYGGVPIYEYELSKPEFQYDFWKVFIDARDTLRVFQRIGTPSHPKPQALYEIMEKTWQKVWVGAQSPEKALAEAEREIKRLNKRLGID